MYKSPIEIKLNDIVSDVIEKTDEYIVKCVHQVGVNVDRVELIKALGYDRGQYEKGWNDRDNEIVRCKDCRFHEHEESGMVWCPNVVGSWMAEDGFCSMGERREDGNS